MIEDQRILAMSTEEWLNSDEDSLVDVDDDELRDSQISRPTKRRANLYDAVAGMISTCLRYWDDSLTSTRSCQSPWCESHQVIRFPIP